jgi:phosphatidylglycerol:prolipoprotein diacylglycerol transferase
LLIGGWLWLRGRTPRPTGWILGEYLLLCGTARFLVEFIRRNPKVILGLSNAQLAAAGCVVAGVCLLVWASTRKLADPERIIHPIGKVA